MAYEPTTPGGKRRASRGTTIFWAILGAVALILLFWLVWDLFVDADRIGTRPVTIEEVVENPRIYEGRELALQGEVARILGPRVFVLGSGNVLREAEILAMSGTGEAMLVTPRDRVGVTGRILRVNRAARGTLEQGLGYALPVDVYLEWEGRPAMIVRELVVVQPEGDY